VHGPFYPYLSAVPANARLQPDLVPAQASDQEITFAKRYLDAMKRNLARCAEFLPSSEEDQLKTLHFLDLHFHSLIANTCGVCGNGNERRHE
jgi:hypothetical protein